MEIEVLRLLTQEVRDQLSCASRQSCEASQPLKIDSGNAKSLAGQHANTRVSDNQQNLLRQIAKRSGRPHLGASISLSNDFTLIDCYSQEEFIWYISWVEDQKLAFRTGVGHDTATFTLSMEGWRQVQPLPQPGGIPGRCFVMSFDESMNNVFELGISKAVTDCGLPAPVRIDTKEHNNQITDEMIAEIRDAEFVIADFTGHRNGVYYEAGFARGLGREVIYCCRDSDFADRHFDTTGINHIKWSTAADLRAKLANRIKATVVPKR